MSIYSDCSQAISDLAELHEVFTEIDVVNHAADDGWNKALYKEARKYANQIVSAKYRNGELVRYGPVEYGGIKDYARRAGMIAYGGATKGPEVWTTPNGSFPPISRHSDTIQTSGRRKGTARHDEKAWSDQPELPADIKIAATAKGAAKSRNGSSGTPSGAAQREIERLTTALAVAQGHITDLERQLVEARSGAPDGAAEESFDAKNLRHEVESIVLELVAGFDGRLADVETRVQRFTAALAG